MLALVSQVKKCAQRAKRGTPVWYLGSWNVRSLVDVEGAVETAKQGAETKQAEDWRIDLVARELDRYCVSVAGLQETRWFGNEIYEVGESVVLTAGRPSPKPGQQIQRGEGVAIVLSVSKLYDINDGSARCRFEDQVLSGAKEMWREGGTVEEKCSALRSTLVTAAESALGTERQSPPDWFREKAASLELLLQWRNHLYSRWLSTKERDKLKFHTARSKTR